MYSAHPIEPAQRTSTPDGRPIEDALDLLEMIRQPWRKDALCRHDDPGAWMVGTGESAKAARLAAVCRECPVHRECLVDGLREPASQRNEGPMRAGLTASQWKRLRRLVSENALDIEDHEMMDVLSQAIVSGDLDLGTRHRLASTLDHPSWTCEQSRRETSDVTALERC